MLKTKYLSRILLRHDIFCPLSMCLRPVLRYIVPFSVTLHFFLSQISPPSLATRDVINERALIVKDEEA